MIYSKPLCVLLNTIQGRVQVSIGESQTAWKEKTLIKAPHYYHIRAIPFETLKEGGGLETKNKNV